MHRVCGAATRHGGRCTHQPAAGRLRCRRHGGASSGPRTPQGKTAAVAASTAGRLRWFAKMRSLKAAGLITKLPVGRKPGVSGRVRSSDITIARAQRQIERLRDVVKKAVPALPADALPPQPPTVAERQADSRPRARRCRADPGTAGRPREHQIARAAEGRGADDNKPVDPHR
jgi:hypothetical protein